MNNEQLIKDVINKKYKINIKNDTHLSEIFEDSFARIEMLFEIEQEIKKKIPEEDVLNIETFGDLIHSINKLQ
jgi:acyl carrier protein